MIELLPGLALREAGPTALPIQLTSLVGRQREVAVACRLLASTRLLTLTGAGGIGKTRLAREVAARAQRVHPDGVGWVELAATRETALVPDVVCAALLPQLPRRAPATNVLLGHLANRRLLLVLDNCEHLVAAVAALVDALLRGCLGLRVLATSREALGVAGETVWGVPPLPLPGRGATPAEIRRSEAAQLFAERARSARPDFALTDANAEAVARICWRLDGLPLALELAAAHSRALSPAQLATRLDDRFRLLRSASRTAVARHQTLAAAIDWSYELLTPREQLLFQRLSVFAGGFSLEAAEAVCSGEPIAREDVLGLLAALVEKSLVEAQDAQGAARYRLLESVSDYAAQRLASRGQTEALQRRHAEFFLALVEAAEAHLGGPEHRCWQGAMRTEADNLRAALGWSREAGLELHLQLIGGLRPLWLAWGHQREARHWSEAALRIAGAAPTRGRAAALLTAGAVAASQMDSAAARGWLQESEQLWRQLGDARREGHAQLYHAFTRFDDDLAGAMETLRAVRSRFQALGERLGESIALSTLGLALQLQGESTAAIETLEEAAALARGLGVEHNAALALQFLASAHLQQGDLTRATALLCEALAALQRDPELVYLARTLGATAAVLARRGQAAGAARLLGAAEALRERAGATIPGFDRALHDEVAIPARAELGEAAFAAEWAGGKRLAPEEAIDFALALAQTPALPAAPSSEATRPGATRPQGPSSEEAPSGAPRAPALRVGALGSLEIERGGVPLMASEWIRPKPRELLVYLLCHPEGRSREQVGLALWPDASSAQVRNSFHVALHRLRRALGAQWVQFERGRYRVAPTPECEFDAAVFAGEVAAALRALTAGAAPLERLRAALSLYRGDFLEGEPAGDWHLQWRELLRRRFLEASHALGALLFQAEQYREAAEVYRKLVARDDLNEEAHRCLMRCHARLADRGGALGHYRRLVQHLRQELDAEPEPETRALFERLQRSEPV